MDVYISIVDYTIYKRLHQIYHLGAIWWTFAQKIQNRSRSIGRIHIQKRQPSISKKKKCYVPWCQSELAIAVKVYTYIHDKRVQSTLRLSPPNMKTITRREGEVIERFPSLSLQALCVSVCVCVCMLLLNGYKGRGELRIEWAGPWNLFFIVRSDGGSDKVQISVN